MPAVTIRNLPKETHRALKVRAAQHGHSTQAEMRAILAAAVRSENRLRPGRALSELSRRAGLTNADCEVLERHPIMWIICVGACGGEIAAAFG